MVIVTANSKRGKQLIEAHGTEWIMLRSMDMQCFGNALGHTLISFDGEHRRNVKDVDDKVFTIETAA